MMTKAAITIALLLLAAAGCGDESGASTSPINAPSGLTAMPLEGGAHLTWMDNSDNEAQFAVQRRTASGEWTTIAMLAPNTTQYHDASVAPGAVYSYRVVASVQANGDGGAPSNEVMFTASGGAAGTGGTGASGSGGTAGSAGTGGGAGTGTAGTGGGTGASGSGGTAGGTAGTGGGTGASGSGGTAGTAGTGGAAGTGTAGTGGGHSGGQHG